ncbi:hypothetical protein J5N97_007324 [Dioscorea zingiberensis]|uniref:Uncharacterized protein n=1 Tax=Dioscorea zingiberensis TaxID=325984 RepID=A0A9D5HUD9_9LILI|nr:hypothetical protein J5N97_007324 [Dioscorea zingiberensis]
MEQTTEDARSAPERGVSESSVLCRGWRLGKKLAVAGVAVTSAPLVIPPLLFLSTVGIACAVPLCVYLAAFAATERVMGSILPLPSGEQPRESEVEAEPLDTVYACIAEEKGRMDDDDDDVGGEEKPLVDVEHASLVENENGEVVVLMAEEKKSEEMELGKGRENRESVHPLVIVEQEIVCLSDSLLINSKEKQREMGEVGMDQEGRSDVGSASMKEEDDENDVKGGIEVIIEEQQPNEEEERRHHEDGVKSGMEKEIDNVPLEIGEEEKLVKNEKEKEGFGIKEIGKEPIGSAETETGAARLSMEHASIVENANGDVFLIVNDPKPEEDELLDVDAPEADKISPTSPHSVVPFDLESSDYASATEDQSCETADADSRVSTEIGTNLPAETEALVKDEGLYNEEKIWEEIYALRTIIGYTRTLSMSPVEELSALYTFAGVEAPVYVKSSPKLKEVNDMLQFLKSVIGVK